MLIVGEVGWRMLCSPGLFDAVAVVPGAFDRAGQFRSLRDGKSLAVDVGVDGGEHVVPALRESPPCRWPPS
jgi:hypothetical protein